MDSSGSSRTGSVRLMTKNSIARSSLVFCALLTHSVYAQDSDGVSDHLDDDMDNDGVNDTNKDNCPATSNSN